MLKILRTFVLFSVFFASCEKTYDIDSSLQTAGAQCLSFDSCSSPSVVILGFTEENKLVRGTGSFVHLGNNKYSILTAAHVVESDDVKLWLALPSRDPKQDFQDKADWKKQVVQDLQQGTLDKYQVLSFKRYGSPDFISGAHTDLALLDVPEAFNPLIEEKKIQPRELGFEIRKNDLISRLADQNSSLFTVTAGANTVDCKIAGYMCAVEVSRESTLKRIHKGELTEFQKLEIDIHFPDYNENNHRSLILAEESFKDQLDPSKNATLMPGDSGSPLIFNDGEKSYVIGVFHGVLPETENSGGSSGIFSIIGGRQGIKNGTELKADMDIDYERSCRK